MTVAKRFPLWFHPGTGQYGKKRHGKYYYFGTDKAKALDRYLREWPDILADRSPAPASGENLTVREAVNFFLTEKKKALDSGKLSAPSWSGYARTAKLVIEVFGRERQVSTLRPIDFVGFNDRLADYNPHTVAGIVSRVRSIFKFAFDYELIDKPVRYGPAFATPTPKEMRLAKKPKLLTIQQVRKLIDAADYPLKAMILLGINAGYGQADCSELTREAIAVDGWIVFPRPKTGISRRCPLWPETVKAIKTALKARPTPLLAADKDIVFITKFGNRFIRYNAGDVSKPGNRSDGIGQEYSKLAKRLKIPTGFYRLRHTHRTVADGAKDQVAAGVIMGHVDSTMAGQYRETVADERLESVTIVVREWLYNKPAGRD